MLRGGPAPPLDICAVHSFPTPTAMRCQQCRAFAEAVAPLQEACTVILGDFNCCAAGEGRMDMQSGSVHLGVSPESEAVGPIFAGFHEVVLYGFSRVQTRDGAPSLMSRLDRVLVNSPVSELIGGGARATYSVQ